MKENIEITFRVARTESTTDAFTQAELDALLEKFPEIDDCPRTFNGLYTYLGEQHHCRTQELMQYLEEAGKVLEFQRSPRSSRPSITLKGIREFDQGDMDRAEYFAIITGELLAYRDAPASVKAGHLVLSTEDFKPVPIGATGGQYRELVCTERLWAEMESEGFRGLDKRSVTFSGKRSHIAEIYKLASTITLPSLLNEFTGDNREPMESYREKGTVEVQDYFFPTLLKLPAGELKEIGPFDLAVTRETFGSVPPQFIDNPLVEKHPYFIVSQAFRVWCESRELPLIFAPVELVD